MREKWGRISEAVRIWWARRGPRGRADPALRPRAARRRAARRSQRLRGRPRRDPQLPAAAAAVGGSRSARRPRHPGSPCSSPSAPTPRWTTAALASHLGPGIEARNHEWWDPDTFVSVGHIGADRIAELVARHARPGRRGPDQPRGCRARRDADRRPGVPARGRRILRRQEYLFPGVSGPELIDVSHWLGALITSADIIGTRGDTPVRALIDEAASLLPGERYALCLVVGSAGLHAAAFGEPRTAWAAATEVAAETHVRYLDAPVRRVLSLIPHKYEDMWTGAKGFYKVEPIVADGGQVVIYAPHIREASDRPAHHRDRLPLPRLLRRSVGPVQGRAVGRPGALDAPARSRHRRPRRRRAPARHRHVGHGDPQLFVRAINLDYLDPAEVDPDGAGRTIPTPSSCPRPARCSTDLEWRMVVAERARLAADASHRG